jgi:uncharacterized protein
MIIGLDRLAARANSGYASGRYDVDGMILYVNTDTDYEDLCSIR